MVTTKFGNQVVTSPCVLITIPDTQFPVYLCRHPPPFRYKNSQICGNPTGGNRHFRNWNTSLHTCRLQRIPVEALHRKRPLLPSPEIRIQHGRLHFDQVARSPVTFFSCQYLGVTEAAVAPIIGEAGVFSQCPKCPSSGVDFRKVAPPVGLSRWAGAS